MTSVMAQCVYCSHYNGDAGTCPAFPDGVLAKVLENRILHNRVLATQKGDWTFHPVDGTPDEFLELLNVARRRKLGRVR